MSGWSKSQSKPVYDRGMEKAIKANRKGRGYGG